MNLIQIEEINQMVTISLPKYSLEKLGLGKNKSPNNKPIIIDIIKFLSFKFFYKNHKKLETRQHNIKDQLIKTDIKY